jgi:PAS domain S-box-containing protein
MIDQSQIVWLSDDFIRLLDWLPAPAFVRDSEGSMRHMNAALIAMCGSGSQLCIGRPLAEVVSEDISRRVAEEDKRVLAGEVVRSDTTVRLPECGRQVSILTTKRAAKHPEWGPVIVGIGQDVTGRRDPEQDETIAHLRHELQGPLSAIAGLSGLLLESPLDAGQRDSLRLIQSTAESCQALLHDMLADSKPGRGEWSMRPKEFTLREYLDDVLKPFELRAASRHLQFSYSVADSAPEQLHSDPLRLRQVLQNLVGNALKYTETGGVVVVVTTVEFEHLPAIEFRVHDTGIGIPQDKQAAIFRPFVQAHGSSTRRYGGTGLGLSIASRIVTLLGGRIWVESEPLRGSTFSFVIPCQARFEPSAAISGLGLDRESALELTGGDGELLRELAVLFLGEYPKLIGNLRAAVKACDPKSLDTSSHALKGAVANFGARAAVDAALWLEARGRSGDMEGIEAGLASLERVLDPLLAELRALADDA